MGQENLPTDYEACGECGFDHGYEPEEAVQAHMTMRQPLQVESMTDGHIILGTFPDARVLSFIQRETGLLPLIIADPPYGNIVKDGWDVVSGEDSRFADWMVDWSKACEKMSSPGAALYVWGGIGRPKFRPFYHYIPKIENETNYRMSSHITWAKKRAYGIQWGYLFCREELAYFVLGDIKKPRLFNVPLLDKKRGYAGYNKDYPAKSENFRRTNVWTDITEILHGKRHVAQKPEKLHEIMIETHTKPGEWVLDPFGGSGTTARAARKLGRKFIIVENDPNSFKLCLDML
jgi:site-specific DNA-methyltransferase (adenine-specific)